MTAAILLATIAAGAVLWLPRLRHVPAWMAMVTPLASIIGSGFLVLGPILAFSYGAGAPLVMALLCLAAWGFGMAIRWNIGVIEEEGTERPFVERRLEGLASLALALAYVISVAYYLNLFGAFGLSLTPFDTRFGDRVLTTAMFALILAAGWTGGFRRLEHLEYITVTLKLMVIAGLMAGLAVFFLGRAETGALVVLPPRVNGTTALMLGFGLIITVQGFETSRYLGRTYPARTRIRSMRWAQIFSTLIYLGYIGFFAYVFSADELELSETATVHMMAHVAPLLPAMLVAAALAAQLSAAVADTGGAGGLVRELSRGRLSERHGYTLLVLAGVAITWGFDVFAIIAYASRAFALYYAIQSAIAALSAHRRGVPLRAALHAGLAVLGVAILLLGRAVEAG